VFEIEPSSDPERLTVDAPEPSQAEKPLAIEKISLVTYNTLPHRTGEEKCVFGVEALDAEYFSV